jgi:hypothetical protein
MLESADLSALLETAVPRERAGSETQARYDFQANYGILELVRLRETGQDFRIIFDVFDDIVVVDSANNPTQARFYQLKSKDPGHWTIHDVCKKIGAEAPRSIVSRLYGHIVSFGSAVVETGLVTNAAYKLKLADGTISSGTHHRIEGIKLHREEIDKISAAVAADIEPADVPAWLPKLAFIRTTLGVHDQKLLVIGRLQAHLEQSDGAGTIKISALYETLHAAIVQRTTFTAEGGDRAVFLSRKSITRQEINELFARANARRRSLVEDWEIIRADLQSHGVGSIAQIKLKTAVLDYLKNRNYGRRDASTLSALAAAWLSTNMVALASYDGIVEIAEQFVLEASEGGTHPELELRAAMIVEAYEATHAAG